MHSTDPAPYIFAAAILSGALCSTIVALYYRRRIKRLKRYSWTR